MKKVFAVTSPGSAKFADVNAKPGDRIAYRTPPRGGLLFQVVTPPDCLSVRQQRRAAERRARRMGLA